MSKKLKIAVIFFGQPRNIQNRFASYSHRFWLRRYDVDYFGHCWFDSAAEDYSVGENVRSAFVPKNAPDKIMTQYPGIRLLVESPMDFSNHKFLQSLNDEIPKKQNKWELLPIFTSQFYSISESIKVYLESKKQNYDFVILSRYDNLILRMPSLRDLPKNKLVASDSRSYFADLIFIGQESHIRALNVYEDLEEFIKTEEDLSPEELKRAAFLRGFEYSDAVLLPFNISLIRTSSVSEILFFLLKQLSVKILRRFRWR